ncbi:MAG: hypothetical protein J5680_00425 [Neisseriaceae bacterium]|nr:hypothetical protein [Neisseriaceae bacterium]
MFIMDISPYQANGGLESPPLYNGFMKKEPRYKIFNEVRDAEQSCAHPCVFTHEL